MKLVTFEIRNRAGDGERIGAFADGEWSISRPRTFF